MFHNVVVIGFSFVVNTILWCEYNTFFSIRNKRGIFFSIFLHFSNLYRNFANLDMKKIKLWLQSLSFRTGVIVLLCCIPFYILSFAQMLLPISVVAKGVLWTVLFGLAKTCQYGGLTILGVEGYKRLKAAIKGAK